MAHVSRFGITKTYAVVPHTGIARAKMQVVHGPIAEDGALREARDVKVFRKKYGIQAHLSSDFVAAEMIHLDPTIMVARVINKIKEERDVASLKDIVGSGGASRMENLNAVLFLEYVTPQALAISWQLTTPKEFLRLLHTLEELDYKKFEKTVQEIKRLDLQLERYMFLKPEEELPEEKLTLLNYIMQVEETRKKPLSFAGLVENDEQLD